uniref:arylamine N-acetyltransferase n=1 Tax=Hucho hucho TaxID=62062 RepID=A0A4W5L9X6_9TELE
TGTTNTTLNMDKLHILLTFVGMCVCSLELPHLYDRIVNHRRQGFCFENNGMFSWHMSETGIRCHHPTEPQKQGHRVYRIRQEGEMAFLEWQDEEKRETGLWTELYKFTLDTRHREDFIEKCGYHQSSSSSIFCKCLCSILKPNRRLTYMGHRLITTMFPSEEGRNITKTTRELTDEIPNILKETFGIVLESPLIPKDEAITPFDFINTL